MSEQLASKTTSAVATSSTKKTFQQLVESDQFKGQLAAALPKHLTPDRFVRVLLTAAIRTPLLMQCTQETLFQGVLNCAAAGLEIDGRRAHLIPFKNNSKNCYEAQLIIDYKGIAELIMRSGVVSSIHADVVCENDIFEVDRGQVVKHTIDYKKDRGAAYAFYCRIVMKDGGEKYEVMSKADVDAIRRRSRAGSSGPWVTDYNEMAKKTVFRRASKWVPLSPEIRNVVEADDDAIDIETSTGSTTSIAGLIGSATEEQIRQAESEKTPPPADAEGAAKAVEFNELEGLILDLGWSEKGALALVSGGTKATKLADLTLAEITGLIALAKKEKPQ
jgi:recombination protein RecT